MFHQILTLKFYPNRNLYEKDEDQILNKKTEGGELKKKKEKDVDQIDLANTDNKKQKHTDELPDIRNT